ncbi:probable tRNA methyltransferase 9B isoform X2 [Dendrobates tinctorius]|uniref:probable tRNA methyltransferase 9B isoform X2 n=1 Tax=Dendrobates tinctorius TaxID=92724 RepID=UPI003CC98ACA
MQRQFKHSMTVRKAMEKEASNLERQHVHHVYEKIAPYFNDKRYKAWPKVQEFLLTQETGSLIADIGCGNGKYLHINSQTYKVGCDYCLPLVEAARNRGYEVMVCDGLHLPYRDGCFDAVLSIAVIHHFSTKERRVLAIKEMSRILKVGGQIMIYVWAMEQKRRKFVKQDLLIPWNKDPCIPHVSDKLQKSRKAKLNTSSLNQHFNTVHASTTLRTKSSSFLDDQSLPYQNELQSSRFLARSLDSGLNETSDSGVIEHNDGSIFRRLYNLCIDIKRPLSISTKHLHFLRNVGYHVQNLENNTNTVAERLSSPITNVTYWKSPTVDLSKEAINDLNTVPLPDLGSECGESTNRRLNCAMNYANPGEKKTRNRRDKSLVGCRYDCEIVSSDQPLLQGVNNACLRYYHIFKQGELSDLIGQCVPELRVVQTFFDHSNWCVVAEKIQPPKI